VRNSDANTNGVPKYHTYCYCDTYPDSPGHSYTYSASYGHTYRHGDAKLHTKLHIHIGDRNARAGSDRHHQPLR
jgi:hypothetical protein